ncbi:TPA: hypothetical protein KJW19_004450, partial [Shigella flexneri]|nr:hypothetical protein [Shigella flexneri]
KFNSRSFRARHGLNDQKHQEEFENAREAGLSPRCVSVVSVNGKRQYTVLYASEKVGSWQLKSQIKESDYQAEFDVNREAGRRPFYLQAYVHNDMTYYSAIFSSDSGTAYRATHGRTGAQHQRTFEENIEAGFSTDVVTGVDGLSDSHRFSGIWTKK